MKEAVSILYSIQAKKDWEINPSYKVLWNLIQHNLRKSIKS